MATYQETEDGALENNGTVVPPGNYLYAQILDEVARGVSTIVPYVDPGPSQDELDRQAKFTGIEFEGVMCSAMKEDQWGLSSIKSYVESGNSVRYEFANGNTLVLTPENVSAFEAVWLPFRASFFPV